MKVRGDSRGHELLLAHCEVIESLAEERPGGVERLTDVVGDRLARLLVFALSADPRRRSRSVS
jgi:predicted transcriptional regulator